MQKQGDIGRHAQETEYHNRDPDDTCDPFRLLLALGGGRGQHGDRGGGSHENRNIETALEDSKTSWYNSSAEAIDAPPNERYANTILEAKNINFAVFGYSFGIIVDTADYDTDQHIQPPKATDRDIQAGVKEEYDTRVTGLDTSRPRRSVDQHRASTKDGKLLQSAECLCVLSFDLARGSVANGYGNSREGGGK